MSGIGESNETSQSCAEVYGETYLFILMGTRCFLALISSICIGCMIAAMVIFQKYRVYTQRLILYLAISTLSYQFVSTIDLASIHAYSNQYALYYCKVIGFLVQVVVWWPILSTAVIVFDIFMKAVFLKKTEKLEKLFVILIFVSPILLSWVPFINNAYGPTGYFCWIRNSEFEDCSKFVYGFTIRFAIFFVPIYIIMFAIFGMLISSFVAIRKRKNTFLGDNKIERDFNKLMEKEIKPLLYYPLIFLASTIGSLTLTIYALFADNGVGLVVLGFIVSILYRLEGVFITLLFICDPETRKKFTAKDIKGACKQRIEKEKAINYPIKYSKSDSIRFPTKSL